MTTEKTMVKRALNIYVKDGVNTDGSDKLKARTYNKVKASASDADILAVADGLGSLMAKEVAEIAVTEKSVLTESI